MTFKNCSVLTRLKVNADADTRFKYIFYETTGSCEINIYYITIQFFLKLYSLYESSVCS